MFHNHNGDQQVIYRYPLVQYKVLPGGYAGILCLEDATEDIHQLFRTQELRLRIGRREEVFKIKDLQLSHYDLCLQDSLRHYCITNYLPFNQQRYQRWQALAGKASARQELLCSTLRGNLLALAKGLGWWIEGRVAVQLTSVPPPRIVRFKQQRVLTFDLDFTTNVNLPTWIGLGKGVSIGHGTVEPVNS